MSAPSLTATQAPPTDGVADPAARQLTAWLIVGLLLRLLIVCTAAPFNVDRHFEVIEYIARHGALPTSNVIDQSYQPPLYYLLMLPVYLATRSAAAVHFATFLISCGTLWVLRMAMAHPIVVRALPRPATRVLAFALFVTMPQLAVNAVVISNDSPTQLVGAAIFLATLRYVDRPTRGRVLALAALAGVGLLTKGTMLLTGVALAGVVVLVERSRGIAWGTVARRVAACCAIGLAIGCYKYVDNTARLGRPFVHNQDRASPTSLLQRQTWRGWETAVDFDVRKIVRRPVIRAYDPESYPLLLYATFWYAHIPETTFPGNLVGYDSVGSAMYVVALVPTLAFAAGVALAAIACARATRDALRARSIDSATLALVAALLLLAANFAVVLAAGLKYDNWSSFHGRLCYASLLPLMLLFGAGVEASARVPFARRAVTLGTWATVACGLLYFVVEYALRAGLIMGGEPTKWW